MGLIAHRLPWTSQPPWGTPARQDGLRVHHAAIGGAFFDSATGREEEASLGTSFVSQAYGEFGACDDPATNPQAVCAAEPGNAFVIIAVIQAGTLTGAQQIIALDPSAAAPSLRTFQFRTNGSSLEFIRFNTSSSVFTVSASLGLSAGQSGTVIAWCNGTAMGVMGPGGSGTATITGTPRAWGASSGYARWFSRRTTTVNEPSTHNTFLRAVVDDPGSDVGRHALRLNPWQIFEPVSIPVPTTASGLPTLGTVSATAITSSAFRPSVTYTY